MVFGRDKKEFKPEEIKLPTLEDLEHEEKVAEEKPEIKEIEKIEAKKATPPSPKVLEKPPLEIPQLPAVPVFIKLERYRDVVKSISSVRNAISTLSNSISLLEEVESVRRETLRTIKSLASLVNEKISDLESLFLRPTLKPKIEERLGEIKGLEGLIKDLKTQVENLKNQLGSS